MIEPLSTEKINTPDTNSGRLAEEIASKATPPEDGAEPPKPRKIRSDTGSPRRTSLSSRAKASAALFNTMFFSLCRTVGGPDAEPSAGEAEELNKALTDYLISTGKTDISPGWVVAGLYSKFLLEKTFKPTVRSRIRAGAEFVRMNLRFKVRKFLKRNKKAKANGTDTSPD